MAVNNTFAQYVISTYGKSVYQIRLEVASGWFIAHSHDFSSSREAADAAWQEALVFVESMKKGVDNP